MWAAKILVNRYATIAASYDRFYADGSWLLGNHFEQVRVSEWRASVLPHEHRTLVWDDMLRRLSLYLPLVRR